ncbi:cytochrome P450 [Mytilinidion resinicola]|uniref:Cytochrome P450 n=1 Tax=Mytilinidion resinicola TaxID=574789 RepID=A0A6A6XZT4_9PEZI|nr:cytochrome P450 [Mytilinidion resinicola]KAF2802071.1 cytochrome P450 [Mytilinidion resinicola]
MAEELYASALVAGHQALAFLKETPIYPSVVAAALGTHAITQLYEPQPHEVLILSLLTNAGLFKYLESTTGGQDASVSLLSLIFKINLLYTATLFLSVAIYRRFFHRARHFPGPLFASLTKFWAFFTLYSGNYHRTTRALHQKYGDFVRVGPREIDICNVHAIQALYSTSTKCTKGPFYEGSVMGSHERFLQNETPSEHLWKRRIWEAGFNTKALRGYEPRVMHFVDELIREVTERSKEGVVDLGLYLSFFTFDIMGDLGFGKSFEMLKHGKEHDYMTIVQGFAVFGGMISTIPWIATTFAYIPRNKAAEGLFTFAKERVKERLPLGQTVKDVFSYLLVEDRVTKKKYSEPELVVESLMLSIGGSDTTSSSLATIIYMLIANPDKFAKLKAEIDPYHGPLNHQTLSQFAYLNAIVREALRILPPIGSGLLHRTTPPEGITIDGTYIPGNMNVGIGAYELQRDPRYYGKPDEFIPERWLGEGPEPFDRNAFMTFSHGPYSCVGKHLAYMELCDVTAALVRAFDMKFAPDYDPSTYADAIKDSVISSRVKLPLLITPRNG